MPEADRVKMLEDLKVNKERVGALLAKMPISMQTTTIQRQKKELEEKMMQIDKAIEMMSRKTVFVKD